MSNATPLLPGLPMNRSFGVVDQVESIVAAMLEGAQLTEGMNPRYEETEVAMRLVGHSHYAFLHNSPTGGSYQEAAIPIDVLDDLLNKGIIGVDGGNIHYNERYFYLAWERQMSSLMLKAQKGDAIRVNAPERSQAAQYNGEEGEITGFEAEGWVFAQTPSGHLRFRPDELELLTRG